MTGTFPGCLYSIHLSVKPSDIVKDILFVEQPTQRKWAALNFARNVAKLNA